MAQVVTNLDEVAKAIAKDLRVLEKDAIESAQKTATFRASRSALSKWVSASAKAARVKAKSLRRRSKNYQRRDGARVIRIGTLPIRGAELSPRESKRGGGVRFYGGRIAPSSFILKNGSVAKRKGRDRYPLGTPVFPVEAQIRSSVVVAVNRMSEQFPKEMTSKLGVELRKLERKRNAQSRRAASQFRRLAG